MPGVATQQLQSVPIFGGLSGGELEQLATSLRHRTYAKGDTLFRRDDPGTGLFIIESGVVRIGLSSPDGKEVTLTLLGRGDFFGELALLDGEPRSADATALERCTVAVLQRDVFLGFLERHPAAAPVLLAAVSRQVRRLTDQVYDAVFLDLPTRLARALLKLAADETERSPGGPTSFHLTQAQLGAIVGATRESVNKWLGFYERRGIIHRERGTVTLLRPKDLESFASFDDYGGW